MLAHLRIENLALVGSLELDLGPGLTVVSGETGAGKSVLVDSLALLVGERAESDAIRSGAASAVVEGLFRLGDSALRRRVAAVVGEEVEEDLALRREIFRGQRNRCFLGGRLSSAALLRDVGDLLLELHGQHEHQRLLRHAAQRELLDAFGGLDATRAALAEEVRGWRADARRLEEIQARDRARAERLRALSDEVAEISAAGIDLEREPAHRAEADRLRNLEDRRERAERLLGALSEGEPSAMELLRGARGELAALARDEPRFAEAHERLLAALEELADLARDVDRYREGLVGDPGRLAELEQREADLLRLARRFRTDTEGLLAREAAGLEELAALRAEAAEAGSLGALVARRERAALALARRLSEGRARAAGELTRAVRDNLRDLGVGAGLFQVRLEPLPGLEPGGLERVDFAIAPNAGEPPGPLRGIASGGELSRVVLAVKAALARADRVPTLVFDEVDAGIGGRVGRRVGEKLAEIARGRQVVVVTHLASVAAPADLHLRVEKRLRQKRTHIEVAAVDGEARVEELSRMLGGDPESETSRSHARELLHAAALDRS
ncbi:MAG: DNA repair protein RecN [Gemmatimonadota bacterium]